MITVSAKQQSGATIRLIPAALLIFLLLGCNNKVEPSKPPSVEQNPLSKPPAFSSPPTLPKEEDAIGTDVWAKYKENEKEAEAKYKYKRTEVTGTIVSVRKAQEFPPFWSIRLRRPGELGECQYLITVKGEVGEEMVKYAKVGHEMTVQGSVNSWDSMGMLYIGGDKLILVR